jgi:hypothetical protein
LIDQPLSFSSPSAEPMEPDPARSNSPPPAAPSPTGTIVVGVLAVAALGLGLYLLLARAPLAPAPTDQSGINERFGKLESRLAGLEQRFNAVEPGHASPSVASTAPAAAPADLSHEAAVPAPATIGTRPPPATVAGAAPGPFDLAANPELKGRLGRIIVTYPADTKISGARTDIYRSGSSAKVKTEFGNVAAELIPASYDVEISGHKVVGVAVEARSDTRISVGVLRLHGSSNTRFDILEPGTQVKIQTAFGDADIGLPAGEYAVKVSDQIENVTITNGKVTEY